MLQIKSIPPPDPSICGRVFQGMPSAIGQVTRATDVEPNMNLKTAVALAVSYVKKQVERLAHWLDGALAGPPMEETEARRRWDDDSVFQPRDF